MKSGLLTSFSALNDGGVIAHAHLVIILDVCVLFVSRLELTAGYKVHLPLLYHAVKPVD